MRLLVISLQRNGAGPRDTLEFSNALCELHTHHEIIISSGNELKDAYVPNEYRAVTLTSTFSSALSFVVATCTLIRPLRLAYKTLRARPDTVVSTHFHPWLVVVSWLHVFRRFFWACATHENPFANKEIRGTLSKLLERHFLRRADLVICHSQFAKRQLAAVLPDKPVIAVPLGAYPTAFVGAFSHPRYAQHPNPLLLFAGRIEAHKGLSVLVEAFELLRSRSISADLLVAGRGDIPDALKKKMAGLGIMLENRWLDAQEMSSYVLCADLLVLPYTEGSQSGVISLALSAGKPVITTRVGGLPEQVDEGKTGLLVKPDNPEALADAIELLLQDTRRLKEMGRNAALLGKTRLSSKRAAEIMLEHMRKEMPRR